MIASSGLTKTGTGMLTLTGNNIYTAGTIFGAGTLNAGSAGAQGSSGTLSFTGGTLQYSAANQTDYSARFSTAASQAYSIDTNGQNVTFATGLTSSSGSLSKSGAGTLTLSGVSNYSGITTVAAGTLAVVSGGSVSTGNVDVDKGATLAISGTGSVTPFFIQPEGYRSLTLTLNGTSGAPASVTLADTGSLTVSTAYIGDNGFGAFTQSGGTLTTGAAYIGYGGGSSGAGTFTQSGGTFTTNLDSLYIADDNIPGTYNLNGGRLTTNNITQGGSGAGTSTFNFNGGTLVAQESNATFFGGLTRANVQANGAIVDTQSFSVTVAQALLHDSSLGSTLDGGLTKLGAGTLTLTGPNTYTGPTTLDAGTLQAGVAKNAFGVLSDVTLNNGSTLDLNGYNETVGSLSAPEVGGFKGVPAQVANVTLGSGTLTVGGDNETTFFAGSISGSGGLNKVGAGTLTLAAPNTFTGPLNIDAGILAVTSEGALGAMASLAAAPSRWAAGASCSLRRT